MQALQMQYSRIKYCFSLAQLIKPVHQPYWQTYGLEKLVIPQHQEVLNNLLSTVCLILTQDQVANQQLEKAYLQELKASKEPIKHNIDFMLNIEWGLLEKLIEIRKEMDEKKYSLALKKIPAKEASLWVETGHLEIYGVSPYRHHNHYISEYIHKQSEDSVTFEKKTAAEIEMDSQTEKLVKPVLDSLEQEKKVKQSGFQSARDLMRKLTKIVAVEEGPVDIKKSFMSLKKKVIEPMKANRILVRDFELAFEGYMTLKSQESGRFLDASGWVEEAQLKVQRQTFQLRTEAWMESKESDSTAKAKRQALTDFNCIMRGNPWCWVKRFDQQ